MLSILLFIVAGWIALGLIGTILSIGKKRPPTTSGMATVTVLVAFGIIVIVVIAGIQLLGV